MTPLRSMTVEIQHWPLINPFVISRGADLTATVVVVCIEENGVRGWGESTPYPRYSETAESVMADIEACREAIEYDPAMTASRLGLLGAAGNAVDCALVDLACKLQGVRAYELFRRPPPEAVQTTATIVLDTPAIMAADAAGYAGFPLIKLKLGTGDEDMERVKAVRRARPDARIICDANEGWSADKLDNYAGTLAKFGVEMVEQPCHADDDEGLRHLKLPILICADESCHVAADVEGLVDKYDLINIKLDKAGGISGALELGWAAEMHEMGVMLGCMLGTSLAMAPGVLAAQGARYVDLDGPLALTRDRQPSLTFRDGQVFPSDPELWG